MHRTIELCLFVQNIFVATAIDTDHKKQIAKINYAKWFLFEMYWESKAMLNIAQQEDNTHHWPWRHLSFSAVAFVLVAETHLWKTKYQHNKEFVEVWQDRAKLYICNKCIVPTCVWITRPRHGVTITGVYVSLFIDILAYARSGRNLIVWNVLMPT